MTSPKNILPPDPEDMNEERAKWAENVLEGFAKNVGEEPWKGITLAERHDLKEQNLSDMLADLGHYCDRQEISLQERLRVASNHYTEETDRKGAQFTPVSNPLEDPSNLATVLAALRLFQRTYEDHEAKDIYDAFPDHFAPVNGKQPEPLSTDDIDALCVDLNCGTPAAAPAKVEPKPHLAQEIIAELEGWAWPVAATKEHEAMKMINAARVRDIIRRRLSAASFAPAKVEPPTPQELAYINAARESVEGGCHFGDEELEIDDAPDCKGNYPKVSEGIDGAFVSAWVWINKEDAGICRNCGAVNADNGEGSNGLCGNCADKAQCSADGCDTNVNPEDPYYATPCGTYCSEHMREHVKDCEACRKAFPELAN
jgi:hypothetical protein